MQMQESAPAAVAARFQRVLLAQMAVADVMQVTVLDMYRNTRGLKRVALARQVAMYLCRQVFEMRLVDVAAAFRRDRSTVRHAVCAIEEAREDPEIDRMVGWMEASLRRTGGPHA